MAQRVATFWAVFHDGAAGSVWEWIRALKRAGCGSRCQARWLGGLRPPRHSPVSAVAGSIDSFDFVQASFQRGHQWSSAPVPAVGAEGPEGDQVVSSEAAGIGVKSHHPTPARTLCQVPGTVDGKGDSVRLLLPTSVCGSSGALPCRQWRVWLPVPPDTPADQPLCLGSADELDALEVVERLSQCGDKAVAKPARMTRAQRPLRDEEAPAARAGPGSAQPDIPSLTRSVSGISPGMNRIIDSPDLSLGPGPPSTAHDRSLRACGRLPWRRLPERTTRSWGEDRRCSRPFIERGTCQQRSPSPDYS
jgi:hypothetical protein